MSVHIVYDAGDLIGQPLTELDVEFVQRKRPLEIGQELFDEAPILEEVLQSDVLVKLGLESLDEVKRLQNVDLGRQLEDQELIVALTVPELLQMITILRAQKSSLIELPHDVVSHEELLELKKVGFVSNGTPHLVPEFLENVIFGALDIEALVHVLHSQRLDHNPIAGSDLYVVEGDLTLEDVLVVEVFVALLEGDDFD